MICSDFSPLAGANVAGAWILAALGKNLNKSITNTNKSFKSICCLLSIIIVYLR